MERGAIDVILNTVRKHIDNPDVCKYGCGALLNIVLNNSKITSRTCIYYFNDS